MPTDGAIEVRDVELVWDRSGTGPTMIWGHGLSSSRAFEDDGEYVDWSAVRREVDVVRYDARGHGESGCSDDITTYGWADLAGDQLALADALGIERYVSGGASMGAATAIHAACRAPDRIRALVLMIPPTVWATRAAQIANYETMAAILEHRGVEQLIAAGVATPPPDPFVGDDAWRARDQERMRAAAPQRLATLFRGAALTDLPPRERVAEIAVPTLVLAWTGDPGHPESTAEELVELIPDARCHVASTAVELATWSETIAAFVTGLG
jgi:3-oxoadipate enol-lactonase